MSAPISFNPISMPQSEFHFNFGDLDSWILEVQGKDEYAARITLANKIVECNNFKPNGLTLEGGYLTSLPKALGLLTHIKQLEISDMPIVELPAEIGQLTDLEVLYVYNTDLSSIPAEIKECVHLKKLYVMHNNLRELPSEIGNLQQLKALIVSDNRLFSHLPEDIGRLLNLEMVDLENTQISCLPIGIFLLENLRELALTGCPFTESGLERLQEHIDNPAFPNRTIEYSEAPERLTQTTDRPLEELLNEIYSLCKKERVPLEKLLEHEGVENLRQFLGKLAYTVDFEQEGDSKPALAQKITEYLELAEKKEAYRDRFFAYLEEAATECGDRISLTIIFLGLEKRLSEIKLNNLHALYELLLGIWSIHLILNIAQETMKSKFTGYESVEVYLGYLTKLREEFNLPLDVQDMLFFKISRISDADLRAARHSIAFERANVTNQSKFLANHDLWQQALERKFPATYDEIMASDDPTKEFAQWTKHAIRLYNQGYSIFCSAGKNQLQDWRSCAWGTTEYPGRSVATARITECEEKQSPELNLIGLGLTSLPHETLYNLPFLRVIDIRGNNIPYEDIIRHPQIHFYIDSVPNRTNNVARWAPY